MFQDDWVVCRVIYKNIGLKRSSPPTGGDGRHLMDSISTLTPLMESNLTYDQILDIKGVDMIPPPPPTNQNQNVRTNPQATNYNNSYHTVLAMANLGTCLRKDEEALLNSSANAMECKLVKHSDELMGCCPSLETGVSMDHNIDISSVVSMKFYDHVFDEPWTTSTYGF